MNNALDADTAMLRSLLTPAQRIEGLLERRLANAIGRAERATPGTVLHRVATRMIDEREDDLLAFRLLCLSHTQLETIRERTAQ